MTARNIRESDHETVVAIVNEWWGGRDMAWLLPRLFFSHSGDTSFAIEEGDELVAFLIGFVSQSKEDEAYIHFVGVHPRRRGEGLGRRLYAMFFEEEARRRGCARVGCITSPVNKGSIAFHTRMGFRVEGGDAGAGGVPVHRDYDGPGEDRVAFAKTLAV
ncbi:MAG: GNAT family N-acetyltransferase [Actinomycetota bacterium]|nr:GNAT family N-acetyltransferase [Actinomycetota bacterium]